MEKLLRLVNYIGNKVKLAEVTQNWFPKEGFTKTWETNGGTIALTANIFSTLKLKEMIVTELDKGMASLLQAVKEYPLSLQEALLETAYVSEEFVWAEDLAKKEYEGATLIERAVAKYVLCQQSFNGKCEGYRNIDYGINDDPALWLYSHKERERYRKKIYRIFDYSQAIQKVKIVEGDMLEMFDDMIGDPERFIYSDVPYITTKRSKNLYQCDIDGKWSEKYAKRIAEATYNGKLKASFMLCNYVDLDNIANDVYAKHLLPAGFTLVLMKEVARPTVIKKDSKKRKKNRAIECVYINYEPLNVAVSRDRIITFEDLLEDRVNPLIAKEIEREDVSV